MALTESYEYVDLRDIRVCGPMHTAAVSEEPPTSGEGRGEVAHKLFAIAFLVAFAQVRKRPS